MFKNSCESLIKIHSKWAFHSPPFSKHNPTRCMLEVGWGGRNSNERKKQKTPKLKQSPSCQLSSWDLKEEKIHTDRDEILEMKFGGSVCIEEAAWPATALACDSCICWQQQPGSGTPVKGHPELQMAHQITGRNYGWGITSAGTVHQYLKAVNILNSDTFSLGNFILFFNYSSLYCRQNLWNWLER